MDFKGTICLSDIPRQFIFTGKTGKKYLSIAIAERREPSAYGDTHSIRVLLNKEQVATLEDPKRKFYIGEARPFERTTTEQPAQPAAQPVAPLTAEPPIGDDLPF